MSLLQHLTLLWRTFTPVEQSVLGAVVGALAPTPKTLMQRQLASINRVQRLLDWTEINFYCRKRGKIAWPEDSLFPNGGEFKLASVKYVAGGKAFSTALWSVKGHVFSFVTRPSIKTHCFAPVSNLVVTLTGDPEAALVSRLDLSEFLPKSYLRFLESHAANDAVNGWHIAPPGETHLVHLAAGDFVVLADREGAEWLLAPKARGANEIYQCFTDGDPELVSEDFAQAVAR